MNKAMTMVLAALATFAGFSEDVRTDPAGNVYARFGSLDRWNSFVATNVVEGLPRSGGDMTGPLNMGFNPITFNGSTNSSEWALWDMLRVWPTGAEGPVSLPFFITNAIAKEVGGVLDAHVSDTNNPHVVTAEQTGAVPLVEDVNREKTAVTIGSRTGTVGPYSLANGNNVTASGSHSHAEGCETKATAPYSHAEGDNTFAKGVGSHAEGFVTTAPGDYSHSEGYGTIAAADYSHAGGHASMTRPGDSDSFAWSGVVPEDDTKYNSHGPGTFNINPGGGVDGFYIGEQTLSQVISGAVSGKADAASVYTKAESDARISAVSNRAEEAYSAAEDMVDAVNSLAGTLGTHTRDKKNPHKVTAAQVGAYTKTEIDEQVIAASNPTFSNAVLAVGMNIDTNSVAVLNEIADSFGGFSIEGTATTVGGLLAALAAAVAWLRKKKIDKLTVTGMSNEVTADGGVAKLDDFFTESNSLLMGTIDARLPYPLYAVPSTGVLKDRALNTTSLASVTVPDNFTDLLIRASVASSLSVTMPEAITTKYGDTFPGEAGEYLITITKTGAAEAYVRTIKLEVANA